MRYHSGVPMTFLTALPILLRNQVDSEAYKMGEWVGKLSVSACIFVGMLWCFRLMAKPGVNRKAMLSLALTLGVWLIAAIAGIASGRESKMTLLLGVVCLLTIPAAALLAILGLVEISSEPGKFIQGKRQAIATLVVGGLFGLVVGFSIVTTVLMKRSPQTAEAADPAAPAGMLTFEDLRFRLKQTRPWVEWKDVKRLNPVATVGLVRTRPQVYLIVIAEKVDPATNISVEGLVSIVKANLMSGGGATAQVLEEVPESLHGQDGIRLVAKARMNNYDLIYRYWIHARPGYAYQLMSWGLQSDKAAVISEAGKVFDGFELLPLPE